MSKSVGKKDLDEKSYKRFVELLDFYEKKENKKALECADKILEVVPGHVDTMSLKGLILSNMGRQKEAVELCKLALRNDLKNHVCWHTLGVVYKNEHEYAESLKCFRSAIRLAPDNVQIVRDMAVGLLHARDLEEHAEMRRRLLGTPGGKPLYLFYALSLQILGDPKAALEVMKRWEQGLPADRPITPDETEARFYYAKLIHAAETPAKALEFMDLPLNRAILSDSSRRDELHAYFQLQAGLYMDAADEFLGLLHLNPNSLEYHAGLQTSIFLNVVKNNKNEANSKALEKGFEELRTLYLNMIQCAPFSKSRITLLKLLQLLPASHVLLGPLLAAFTRDSVRKGIPSAFADFSRLLTGDSKIRNFGSLLRRVDGSVFEDPLEALQRLSRCEEREHVIFYSQTQLPKLKNLYVSSLHQNTFSGATFVTSDGAAKISIVRKELQNLLSASSSGSVVEVSAAVDFSTPDLSAYPLLQKQLKSSATSPLQGLQCAREDGKAESPASFPFASLFEARFCDLLSRSSSSAALELLDAAIKHTPTLPELHSYRARALKHEGRLQEAYESTNDARELDLADRFLNNKAVKYALRAGDYERAVSLLALFARQDPKKPHMDVLANTIDTQILWWQVEAGESLLRSNRLLLAMKHFRHATDIFRTTRNDGLDFHSYCTRKGTLTDLGRMLKYEDRLHELPLYIRAFSGLARTQQAILRTPGLAESLAAEASAAKVARAADIKLWKEELPPLTEEEENSGAGVDVAVRLGVDPDPLGFDALETLMKKRTESLTLIQPVAEAVIALIQATIASNSNSNTIAKPKQPYEVAESDAVSLFNEFYDSKTNVGAQPLKLGPAPVPKPSRNPIKGLPVDNVRFGSTFNSEQIDRKVKFYHSRNYERAHARLLMPNLFEAAAEAAVSAGDLTLAIRYISAFKALYPLSFGSDEKTLHKLSELVSNIKASASQKDLDMLDDPELTAWKLI